MILTSMSVISGGADGGDTGTQSNMLTYPVTMQSTTVTVPYTGELSSINAILLYFNSNNAFLKMNPNGNGNTYVLYGSSAENPGGIPNLSASKLTGGISIALDDTAGGEIATGQATAVLMLK